MLGELSKRDWISLRRRSKCLSWKGYFKRCQNGWYLKFRFSLFQNLIYEVRLMIWMLRWTGWMCGESMGVDKSYRKSIIFSKIFSGEVLMIWIVEVCGELLISICLLGMIKCKTILTVLFGLDNISSNLIQVNICQDVYLAWKAMVTRFGQTNSILDAVWQISYGKFDRLFPFF